MGNNLPAAEVAPENSGIAVGDSSQPIENRIVFEHDLSLFRKPTVKVSNAPPAVTEQKSFANTSVTAIPLFSSATAA
ncbi:hypothetical protein ACFQ4L_08010 [Lapidilactobacillus mulanensis]|uniref:Uncharacterized protein n=1 Tax=Lapidilactobacillus mulanensis TaxID=2485999 RepID=A0ABW4DRZ2_9LACO